ncbi:MAG: cupin-like domain-containing protein [Acidiferrobacterales bacterium]|nr:cupin-like domain-containing protein [Acidiferrobacterales bacterium]
MFEAVQYIDVDRKNSLPVADFTNRYKGTSTPVVFGDMTHRWLAYEKWTMEFLKDQLSDVDVDLYSNKQGLTGGDTLKAVMHIKAREYFNLLEHGEDDLQIRNLKIFQLIPGLEDDIVYPRLGINFKRAASRLNIGSPDSLENMHYRPDLAESFLCNFGGKQTVLLVRPEQAKYTYEPESGFESIHTVDYGKDGLEKHPALHNINAYYAELKHGDVLYIPSEYRYSAHFETVSASLLLAADPDAGAKIRGMANTAIAAPLDRFCSSVFGASWQRRKVRKAVRRSKR